MNLDKLLELAEKATPGPWTADHRVGLDIVYTGSKRGCVEVGDGPDICRMHGAWIDGAWTTDPRDNANAAYIAAASPEVVTALVRVAQAAQMLMAAHGQMGEAFIPHDEIELRAALAEVTG